MSEQNKNIQMYEVNGDFKSPLHPLTKSKNVTVDSSENENLPLGTATAEDVFNNLGALAFENEIEIPEATTEEYGVVVLSDETDNQEEGSSNTAATTKAVSKVSAESVKLSGDQEISDIKNFKDGVKIGNAVLTVVEDTESDTTTLNVDFEL